MATKHDEFKVYYFSFTDEELQSIVKALIEAGEDDLATEISDEADLWPDDIDGGVGVATLKIDIDTSVITEVTEEIANLEKAVDALADAYVRLNEAQKGPVEYSLDATDRLIKELLAGVSR